jgi:transcriptional regulator with PAS, ATPase and Fis domain
MEGKNSTMAECLGRCFERSTFQCSQDTIVEKQQVLIRQSSTSCRDSSEEDIEVSPNTSRVKPKPKKLQLTRELLQKYFDYSQVEAAAMLGVSLSTLKRKCKITALFS